MILTAPILSCQYGLNRKAAERINSSPVLPASLQPRGASQIAERSAQTSMFPDPHNGAVNFPV